jgi:ATP-dependent DNA ligase
MHAMSALIAVRELRPQPFGSVSPGRVVNPIVEPLWSGVRVLAAVDGRDTAMVDQDGERVTDQAEIEARLAGSVTADGLVIDGYLTKQVSHDGTGVYTGPDPVPSGITHVGRSLLGTRRNRHAEAAERMEREHAARTFDPDDTVTLVATDLLWVDGTSLLDVPLLERRRQLEAVVVESDLVRRGVYVRPPLETWIGSWRDLGFAGVTYKAANGRYHPGDAAKDDWASTPMPRR